jgi:iron(III) transport system substrate-binding protein
MRQLSRHAGWSGICGLIMMLAALNPHTEASAQLQVNWKANWEATRTAAEKEGRLIIYGPTGIDQQRLYTDMFQQTFPKIQVNYTPGRISEIISRIMAEQRAGIRQADLVLGGTDILLGTLKDKGFLQPIRPVLISPEVLDTGAWFKRKLWFADSENKFVAMWRAVPYTAACINTNLIKANELKSYWDLLNPKWKGKIVSQDLTRLYSEMDITVSRSLPQISDWIAGGKFAIALGGIDCQDMTGKGLPVTPIHFEGLAAVGAGTDPAAFLASAPHTNAAKIFLNWILTREGQNQFQRLTRENSLRVDIPKEGIVDPFFILDPNREYLFTGLEEFKDKINEFRPWLESLVQKK